MGVDTQREKDGFSVYKNSVIADDIELIKEQLEEYSNYSFKDELIVRMDNLGLSQSALAKRIGISHTAVGKWLNRGEKPKGKERYKELGMALGMDEIQLNTFLMANFYPRLYSKNPLDAACRVVLTKTIGREFAVKVYKDFLRQYNYDTYTINREPTDIFTTELSHDLDNVSSIESLEKWIKNNSMYFRACDKSYIPHAELIRFILLYIGEQSINDMYTTGDLPVTIKNLLYPLIAENEIAVKGLRTKLIVFGLYQNMNENEINIMLNIVKLQPITEPVGKVDNVLLAALRCAHERYPFYELRNAEKALNGMFDNDMPELRDFFHNQKARASGLVDYYEKDGRKEAIDLLFEDLYTDYADSNILVYMRDIFEGLVSEKILSETEISDYTVFMQTYKHYDA